MVQQEGYTLNTPTYLELISKSPEERREGIDAPLPDGNTQLHHAARKGSIPLCSLLIESGASVHSKNPMGATPLHFAAMGGHAELCTFLIKNGASLSRDPLVSSTALHTAAAGGHHSVCAVLVAAGSDVNSVDNGWGSTALFWAAFHNHARVCKMLVSLGADVNRRNKKGMSPLNIARTKGHNTVAAYLISVGASVAGADGAPSTSPLVMSNTAGTRMIMGAPEFTELSPIAL